MGNSKLERKMAKATVTVTGGTLDFGPWEVIFYGEFDEGRSKRVLVKVIGERGFGSPGQPRKPRGVRHHR